MFSFSFYESTLSNPYMVLDFFFYFINNQKRKALLYESIYTFLI